MLLLSWPTLTPAFLKTQRWSIQTMVGEGSSLKSRVRELLAVSHGLCILFRSPLRGAVGPSAAEGPRGSRAFYFPGGAPQKRNDCFQLQRCKFWIVHQMKTRFVCQVYQLHQTLFFSEIPVPVEEINSTEHPLKVGLSDAFMGFLPAAQRSGQCFGKGRLPLLVS